MALPACRRMRRRAYISLKICSFQTACRTALYLSLIHILYARFTQEKKKWLQPDAFGNVDQEAAAVAEYFQTLFDSCLLYTSPQSFICCA